MPVLHLSQDRLDIPDYRTRAQADVGNGDHGRRDLVGKESSRSWRFRELGIESDFVVSHLPLERRRGRYSLAVSFQRFQF